MNELILGDNLEVLRHLPAESVDLIYLDPSFFSNRTYEVIWGDAGERRSFEDRWSGGTMQYIDWLNERVRELHRVLKPTGSLFLHCDWHADAYIKIFILDKLFGEENFRAEIVWKRTSAHGDAKNKLGVLNDAIYYLMLRTELGELLVHGFQAHAIKLGLKTKMSDTTFEFECFKFAISQQRGKEMIGLGRERFGRRFAH